MKDWDGAALEAQAIAAKALAESIGALDDEELHDLVEGETEFFEAVEIVLRNMDEAEIQISGLSAHIGRLQDRLSRYKKRHDALRGLIDQAFQAAGVKSHAFPTATISTKKVPPALLVNDEAEVPSRFFVTPAPKLDKAALKKALQDQKALEAAGEKITDPITGAELTPEGTTIQIRRS